MDLMKLRVFQRHVADQCRIVIVSVPQINEAVAARDQDSLWVACQMFVVGAGNISKALWGQAGKLTLEREPLRDSLGVTNTSPLRIVNMRNNFEHYDERIDTWWDTCPNHNILDRMIGSPDAVVGLSDTERFRVYDPTSGSIVFWGQQFELQPIATEVDRIFPIAEKEAAKPHWTRP
jgi:hypothetical protein